MRKNLPDEKSFIGLSVDGDFKIIELIGKGCNALVFRGYSESLNQSVAYKIIPRNNLASGDSWKTEAKKANSLGNDSVVHCSGFEDWLEIHDCIILKYDYVDGMSLKAHIKENKNSISISFIRGFLECILGLFYEMMARNIQHGDFHSGNILVMKPSEYQRNSSEKFKITDFGIGEVTSHKSHLDDFQQLSRILIQLLECIDYQRLSPEEKYIFNIFNDHFAAKHLIERDITLDPLARNPDLLLNRLDAIDADYAAASRADEKSTLLTPFDYLSCEQIGQQHSLLHALYSEKFLGISEIESAYNLVVTGPRGCGKSTVFRSLSLKHRLIANNNEDVSSLRYVGIYYHCHDLYFKFPRYEKPVRMEALDLPLHYLTCRLLVEVLSTLRHLLGKNAGVESREVSVSREIWKILELARPSLPSSDTFSAVISGLQKECQWAADKYRFSQTDQPIKPLYGPDKFIECCALIQREISALSETPFFCFIDDYSMPHISCDLQRTLNRLLMQRNAHCFFKMATESPVSYAASDIDEKSYTEGREFEVLNLGLIYLQGSSARKLEFLDDIFSRRLKAVSNYPVTTLFDLVGDGDGLPSTEIAEKIATDEKPIWSGRTTLSNMCSGDIHQLITLVRMMVAEAGGIETLRAGVVTPKVALKYQNKAIRAHAGNFLQNLANSGAYGERLRKIVSAFGVVAHSYIRYKQSKNGTAMTRHQASRIELHEAPLFDGEAREIYDELLRYSVFIQDPRGKSIRGNIVPRLYLRRFLVPHFNLTFSRRDSVLMSVDDFRELLLDPEKFEDKKRLRKLDDKSDPHDDSSEQFSFPIFSEARNDDEVKG